MFKILFNGQWEIYWGEKIICNVSSEFSPAFHSTGEGERESEVGSMSSFWCGIRRYNYSPESSFLFQLQRNWGSVWEAKETNVIVIFLYAKHYRGYFSCIIMSN